MIGLKWLYVAMLGFMACMFIGIGASEGEGRELEERSPVFCPGRVCDVGGCSDLGSVEMREDTEA